MDEKEKTAPADRNAQLIADKKAGMSIRELSKKYEISPVRVSQIWSKSGEVWEREERRDD
jgi:Mor family transcriptional regulator